MWSFKIWLLFRVESHNSHLTDSFTDPECLLFTCLAKLRGWSHSPHWGQDTRLSQDPEITAWSLLVHAVFQSEMIAQRRLILIWGVAILTRDQLRCVLMLVFYVSGKARSMDPLFTEFTLHFATVCKRLITLGIFLWLQNSVLFSLMFL